MLIFVAVQEERGPRKSKTTTSNKRNNICKLITTSTMTNFPFVHPHHELAAQILLVTIRQARFNSGFGVLDRVAQNEILGRLWAPLFILRAAYWPTETEKILAEAYKGFKILRELQIDAFEMELLENFLLCRADLISDLGQAALAQSIREKSIEALMVFNNISYNNLSQIRFFQVRLSTNGKQCIKLLLALPLLFHPSASTIHTLLFKPIIGAIPIETVISTI